MGDLDDKLNELPPGPPRDKVKEFVDLMFDEDCRKDPDCEDITSSCCGVKVDVVFGSFPVEVECSECGKREVLRKLLLSDKKSDPL